MNPTSLRSGVAAVALCGLACGGAEERAPAAGAPAGAPVGAAASPHSPDSAAAAAVALDTLRRLGSSDFIVDSLVRHGDTVTVWTGPRVWMATDRPTTAVSVVAPVRVVGVRQVLGG